VRIGDDPQEPQRGHLGGRGCRIHQSDLMRQSSQRRPRQTPQPASGPAAPSTRQQRLHVSQ
jgi:hypothetical protein